MKDGEKNVQKRTVFRDIKYPTAAMNLLCATQKGHLENMREVFTMFNDNKKKTAHVIEQIEEYYFIGSRIIKKKKRKNNR